MKILVGLLGVMMIVGGALLTAGGNGWIDTPYDQEIWITLGPVVAGFGVALLWVLLRPRR